MKKKGEGAWIFVSHSHKDIDKVRFIRNEFEKRGHNPLLFFLKCLNDEAELDDLIKREITERNWFILCDSPNARASKWVQDEVEMIKSLEGKVFETIDLNDDIEIQLEKITNFSKRSTVFLSYTMKDKEIGDKIIDKLKKYDFGVFDYRQDIKIGDRWEEVITNAIDDAVSNGHVILLLSKHSFMSKWVLEEVSYAINNGGKIIPVIIDEDMMNTRWYENSPSLSNETSNLWHKIKQMNMHVIDMNNIDQSIEDLVVRLKFLD